MDVTATPESRRKALRQQAIAAREALPAAAHAAASAQITEALHAVLATHPPARLAFCWPYRAEYDARALVTSLLARGWQAALPVVSDHHAHLAFRPWQPDTALMPDRYGIPTPLAGDFVLPEVILLPFNVLDEAGYRLGYGAGFFDRTLAVLSPRPWVIGVGFALGLAETIWPQAHDIPVDCAVTEAGLIEFVTRGQA